MAVDLHGRESLLPSQFFTEDDFISEKKHINKGGSSGACFAWDVPNRVASCGSSLIEMESDEDDCIAKLTRRLAQSQYLLEEDDPDVGSENPKLWGFTGWPQSTLWSPLGPNLGTQRETPVSPATAISGKGGTWDLFYDAAGINDDGPRYHHSQKLPATSLKSSLINPVKNPNAGFYSNQDLSDDHLRAFQFYQLKQQQLMKQNRDSVLWERRGWATQRQQSKERACSGFGNTPTWAALPQQPTHKAAGSGLRAIFLRGSDSRSGSCGTGVFLPRGTGNPSDSRKKQECSTALIPARVAQALKLNFDEMGVVSPSLGGRLSLQHDAAPGRRNSLYPPQKQHWPAPPAMKHQEMNVPRGWTR